jgi:translation initiation factor IF-3
VRTTASARVQGGGLSHAWPATITTAKEPDISEPRINDRIRVPEVRLIGPDGEQVGVVRTEVALRLAQDADLDLVEVAPDARPPVCKLMDFGKFKYEADMKAREARRNQANTVLKEIRFRLKIDPHDYETKKGHVVRFLSAGDKVKVMIMFRGREQSRPEMGVRLLQRLAAEVSELGWVESMPKQDGRNMTMVLGPVKKKADAKTEQRKRSAEVDAGRMTKSERKAAERATDEVDVMDEVDADEVDAMADADATTEVTEVTEVTEETSPVEAPQAAAPQPATPEPVVEAPQASAPEQPAPERPTATRGPATSAAAPRATAPRTAAPKAAAPKAATSKPATTAPKPASAPKPAAAPRPAAPKPSATPRPAPKPAARPRPAAKGDKG